MKDAVCLLVSKVKYRDMRSLPGRTVVSSGKRSSIIRISANQGPKDGCSHRLDRRKIK